MTFSQLIKSRREELGLTLEEVSRVVGVKKSTILRWENGEINNPRRDRIALLAAVLQLPPMELIKETCGLPEDYPVRQELVDKIREQSRPRPRGARILSSCAEVMKPDELDRAIGMMKIMFPQYNDILERKEDDNEP